MYKYAMILLVAFLIFEANALEENILKNKPIHVVGEFQTDEDLITDEQEARNFDESDEASGAVEDKEMKFLKNEIKNVKNLKRGYKKKSKLFVKLSGEAEGLKENFESYLEHKEGWDSTIGSYNELLECTKKNKYSDCGKNNKKEIRRPMNQVSSMPLRESGSHHSNGDSEIINDQLSFSQSSLERPVRKGHQFIRMVNLAVINNTSRFNSCYKRSRTEQYGMLPVILKISATGVLNHVTFPDTSSINNHKLIKCMTRVLYGIQYPRTPNGREMKVNKPFVFSRYNS